jgi:LL-diaminopimelate aminotransferase
VRSNRINRIPPYMFAELDRKKAEARAKGIDLITFGVGDPDQPPPPAVVAELCAAARDPANLHYPETEGVPEFRQAAAAWYGRQFGVDINPQQEVMTLIGSKEGIAHLCLALLDDGDYSLVPDPAYPVFRGGTILAGGIPHPMPLLAENGFLPDLSAIDTEIAKKAKVMFLNYPNNPTGAVAADGFFPAVIEFAKSHNLIVCHDFAYGTVGFDGYQPPSFLSFPGAKELGVEFNSLSKPFNMTGWRIGFVVGNPDVIAALGVVKNNVDTGVFNPIQIAGVKAFATPPDFFARMNEIYRRRRDIMIEGLNALGWQLEKTRGTFYLWVPVPEGHTSTSFAALLLEEARVLVGPGIGYGDHGEGYVRMALTIGEDRMKEALERIAAVLPK